jgi:hypothetical protein
MRSECVTKDECRIINKEIRGIFNLILKINDLRNHIRIK